MLEAVTPVLAVNSHCRVQRESIKLRAESLDHHRTTGAIDDRTAQTSDPRTRLWKVKRNSGPKNRLGGPEDKDVAA